MHDFDKILEEIGGFGKYQKMRFIYLCIPAALMGGWGFGISLFLILPPTHRCNFPSIEMRPAALQNATETQLIRAYIPEDSVFAGTPSRCQLSDVSKLSMQDFEELLQSNESFSTASSVECPYGWHYASHNKWTIVNEWDLVCDHDYLGSLFLTIESIGGVVGTFVFSILQDKFGRKITIFIVMPWALIWGVASAFMPTIWSFIACRTVKNMIGLALFQVPYVMALEMVDGSKHTFVINVMSILFAIAMALVALVAWLCPTWQYLILVTQAPFIFAPILWFLVDESPRWLLSVGQEAKALKIIQKMAKINSRTFELERMESLIKLTFVSLSPFLSLDFLNYPLGRANILLIADENTSAASANFFTIWKHRNLAVLELVLAFLWSVNAMIYIGLTLNVQNFGANPYVVVVLISLAEIPSEIFNFIVNKVGRIWPACLTMALSGLSLLAASATPQHMTYLVIVLVVVSKFCITSSFCVLYQMAGELFPTVIRATGIGFATMVSQVLTVVTPFVIYSSTAYQILPMIILGGLAVIGGVMAAFLPETLGQRMPEFISDISGKPYFGFYSFKRNVTCRSVRMARQKQKDIAL